MTIGSTTVSQDEHAPDVLVDLTFTSSQVTTNFVSGDITVTNGVISDFEGIEAPEETALSTENITNYLTVALYNKGPNNLTVEFAYLGISNAVKVMSIKNSTDTGTPGNLVTLTSSHEYNANPVTISGWNTGDYILIYLEDKPTASSPNNGSACYIYISNSVSELGLDNKPTSINCYYGGGTIKLRFSDIGSRTTGVETPYDNNFFSDLDDSIWENGSTYGDLYYYFNETSGTTLLTNNFGSNNEVNSTGASGMYESTTYSSTPYVPVFFFSTGEGVDYTATFSPFDDGLCTAVVPVDTFTDRAGNDNQVSNTFSWTYDGTGPVMTITSSDVTSGSTTFSGVVALTFTSNEETTDFESTDITVSNGEISDFSGSGTTYTANFTSGALGECSVLVNAATFSDVHGQPNPESHTFIWTYDSTGPTMNITSSSLGSGSSTSARAVYLVFTSSEPTIDFFPGDISFSGGTLSRFTCADCNSAGAVYTVMFTIESACATGSIWVEAGKFTDTAGNTNEASNVFEWIYIPACPIAPILPTGVLAPSSGNISAKMRQAQRIKYSTAHGGMRYVSNRPTVDTLIRPIGQIYYAKYITFYYYAKALTISQFLSTIPWSNYGNTAAESLQFAAIYLTMLFNVQRRLSAELLLPYYRTSTYVYYLKYVDGCILNYNQISGDFSRLELTSSTKYYFIFNNLS